MHLGSFDHHSCHRDKDKDRGVDSVSLATPFVATMKELADISSAIADRPLKTETAYLWLKIYHIVTCHTFHGNMADVHDSPDNFFVGAKRGWA